MKIGKMIRTEEKKKMRRILRARKSYAKSLIKELKKIAKRNPEWCKEIRVYDADIRRYPGRLCDPLDEYTLIEFNYGQTVIRRPTCISALLPLLRKNGYLQVSKEPDKFDYCFRLV